MARSRVINIQRVSLSIYVYVSESDTYDTHATPFRGKKKKRFVAGRSVHDPRNPLRNEIQRRNPSLEFVFRERAIAWQFRVSRTSVKIVTRDRLS